MTPLRFGSDLALDLLLGSVLVLAAALLGLVAATTLLQLRADRRNARRIAAFQRWEAALPVFLFREGEVPEVFTRVAPGDRAFLLHFLSQARATLGGAEGHRLRQLYYAAGLDRGLEARLRHRSPRTRATAALEVGGFGIHAQLPRLVPLLDDPVPYVAFAAARTLAQTGNLTYAAPVLEWVVTQERYQQVRLIAILESFGPDLLAWLEARFRDRGPAAGGEWRFYAQLASSHRHHESLPVLLELLESADPEVQGAALRALQTLGDPVAYPHAVPFVRSEDPVLRMQAAQAVGVLGGAQAIPDLLHLLADEAYDVRRHASHGLANLGERGIAALRQVTEDLYADAYARDMAMERLEWAEQRGRL